ncbi:MAG: fibronectin type III domain-containing protein [Bacteroidaceae bacterium]|nr:fibronectin type III domain-containing protein [Bacteroidaceae bacterium]
MNRKKYISFLYLFALLFLPIAVAAQEPLAEVPADSVLEDIDSLENSNYRPLVRSKMNLMARAYGDSIVLRWAAEDFVSWRYLNEHGVNLLRIGPDGADTLAFAFKPLSKEQMLAKYTNPADSLAGMVAELTWGDGRTKPDQTRNRPGTMGALVEMSEEQNMVFGMAVLITEWRRDLAEDLAMRFVDRGVKRGEHYQYILQPTVWDEDSMLIFQPGFIQDIENTRYKPEPFDVTIRDSIVGTFEVDLEWDKRNYSSFEIERRLISPAPGSSASGSSATSGAGFSSKNPVGGGSSAATEWHRANKLPFVPFLKDDLTRDIALYADFIHQPGTYEYRVRAHDAFGDLTEPSPSVRVEIGDRIPPAMPTVLRIEIDRSTTDRVFADITWETDTIDADLKGFLPIYHHQKFSGDSWMPLLNEDELALPTDTTCRVEVTGLPTGMLAVAAVDQSGNVRLSMPVQIRIEDMAPPPAPKNLRAEVNPDGRVILRWSAPSDDIDYYQVAFANDTTHAWHIQSEAALRDTIWTDTLALGVNQKYIYYKVRAVDFSTNEGAYSDILQVKRPTLVPPTVAHLDSAFVDPEGVHMRWVVGADELMDYHLLWRRLDNEKRWTMIARLDADSVKALGNLVNYTDQPAYNREHRYLYAVESFNSSDISSGMSLAYTVKRRPPLNVRCSIRLIGEFDSKKGESRLAWEVSDVKETDYYFSVYRMAPGDDLFRAVTTATKDDTSYSDVLLEPGEEAQFYVKLMTRDGRESQPSEVITIRRPKEDPAPSNP